MEKLNFTMFIQDSLMNRNYSLLPFTQTSDLFGEFDSMGISKRSRLLVDVVDVQNLTHKRNHRLSFVECSGRHCREYTTWSMLH